ncbi:MAG: hypothetical protein AB1556_02120 [Bacillota bacterium]
MGQILVVGDNEKIRRQGKQRFRLDLKESKMAGAKFFKSFFAT